ncbi:MAG: AsmA family protein [Planctomycetota bacterium]|jgi:uncharacterized protein involved in outer membrane biogenesis
MKKKLLIALGVIVLLVVVGLVIFVLTLDSTIKTAVEEGGSHAMKTDVKLEEVDLSITDGKAALKGFAVANPEGYPERAAISLDEISTEIKLSSLTSDVIEVPSIVIRKPNISIDTKAGGFKGSNIQQLLKNLEDTAAEYAGEGDGGEQPGEEPEEKPAAAEGAPQHYRVGKIVITDITVGFSDSVLTKGESKKLVIKEVDVPDLSTEMTMGEIIKVSINAIMRTAAKQGGPIADFASQLSGGRVQGAIDDVKKQGQDALDRLKKIGEDATQGSKDGKKPGEVIDDVKKGIGDLFKKKDEGK